jgi:hypothetical protein
LAQHSQRRSACEASGTECVEARGVMKTSRETVDWPCPVWITRAEELLHQRSGWMQERPSRAFSERSGEHFFLDIPSHRTQRDYLCALNQHCIPVKGGADQSRSPASELSRSVHDQVSRNGLDHSVVTRMTGFSNCKTSPNSSPNCAPYMLQWLRSLLSTPLKTLLLRPSVVGC